MVFQLPKQARYQLRYTRINTFMKLDSKAGALPVAVPDECPRPIGLRPSSTAATRSAPFFRPRRRSPRSPTALHPDKNVYIIRFQSRRASCCGAQPIGIIHHGSQKSNRKIRTKHFFNNSLDSHLVSWFIMHFVAVLPKGRGRYIYPAAFLFTEVLH